MPLATQPPGSPPSAAAALRAALGERVVIADGAMGSMPQGSAAALDDFAGHGTTWPSSTPGGWPDAGRCYPAARP